MSRVKIACVGGFLGAGKTTALKAAVIESRRRNLKVGVITNDQGTEIIDTKVMQALNVPTREIGGGCFCCKFSDLIEKADQILAQEQPDIILAEAVGSCTDLSATVYQPLRKYYGHQFDLAPLTILVEPHRINLLEEGGQSDFPETVHYLFKKQLAEADLILVNKLDTVGPDESEQIKRKIYSMTGIPVLGISALNDVGIADWIDLLLTQKGAGNRILDLNYDTYARAEAALGWLNATVEVTSNREFSPKEFGLTLIRHFQDGAIVAGMNIAHLKILVATSTETDRIALTENEATPQWSDGGQFAPARDASLTINARVHASPDDLSRLSQEMLARTAEQFQVKTNLGHLESFSPLPPKPQYRMAQAAS